MGIADMRKRNVAVRHLDAVETLGSVQVFCMDKTGTLTLNRMAVVQVYGGQQSFRISEGEFRADAGSLDPLTRDELVRLMQVVSLCSETEIKGSLADHMLEGSPTENALVELALNSGIDVPALRNEHPTLRMRYRAEGRPYMSTLHGYKDGKFLLAVKGSPEEVLAMCDHQIKQGKLIRLSRAARAAILAENERMAGDALRVLGVAYRELDDDRMPRKTENLVWLGLAGMADPMRPGMDKLIAKFHRAGIETIMITGDQSATASAIGHQLGLSRGGPLQVLESSKLENMDPALLAGLVKNVHVFARVSPAHKLKIVQALQDAGYVVAMTGDGINDGPALKAADIGVAMGGGGTNVARDVSDVVLEDDNLHTMSTAVRQGRTIYNNIRKMIHFMVSTNLTEIEVMLAGIAFGLGQPMNPMQLLWINLVTDIFPGLALALEPAEPGIMDKPPRDPDEAIQRGPGHEVRDVTRLRGEKRVPIGGEGLQSIGRAGVAILGRRDLHDDDAELVGDPEFERVEEVDDVQDALEIGKSLRDGSAVGQEIGVVGLEGNFGGEQTILVPWLATLRGSRTAHWIEGFGVHRFCHPTTQGRLLDVLHPIDDVRQCSCGFPGVVLERLSAHGHLVERLDHPGFRGLQPNRTRPTVIGPRKGGFADLASAVIVDVTTVGRRRRCNVGASPPPSIDRDELEAGTAKRSRLQIDPDFTVVQREIEGPNGGHPLQVEPLDARGRIREQAQTLEIEHSLGGRRRPGTEDERRSKRKGTQNSGHETSSRRMATVNMHHGSRKWVAGCAGCGGIPAAPAGYHDVSLKWPT